MLKKLITEDPDQALNLISVMGLTIFALSIYSYKLYKQSKAVKKQVEHHDKYKDFYNKAPKYIKSTINYN